MENVVDLFNKEKGHQQQLVDHLEYIENEIIQCKTTVQYKLEEKQANLNDILYLQQLVKYYQSIKDKKYKWFIKNDEKRMEMIKDLSNVATIETISK